MARMIFQLPEELPVYEGTGWTFLATYSGTLDPDRLDALVDALGPGEDGEGDYHAAIDRQVTFLGATAHLECGVGVHPKEEKPAFVHWHVRVSQDREPPDDRGDENALSVIREIARVVGAVSARMNLYWRLSKTSRTPVVELPITTPDLLGFSEIRGVRLAQVDETTGDELYSMILDRYGRGEFSASVAGEIQTQLDEQLVLRGVEFALEIAALGLDEPPEHADDSNE